MGRSLVVVSPTATVRQECLAKQPYSTALLLQVYQEKVSKPVCMGMFTYYFGHAYETTPKVLITAERWLQCLNTLDLTYSS